MSRHTKQQLFLWGLCVVLTLWSPIYAKDVEDFLLRAGFTAIPDPEKFQEKPVLPLDEIPFSSLRNGEVFFWSEVRCSQQCRDRFKFDEVVIIHRWVREYGSKMITTQVQEFSLRDLLEGENLIRSAQEIKGPSAWFVEIRLQTLDGETLCISSSQKDEPDICKFRLRVKE